MCTGRAALSGRQRRKSWHWALAFAVSPVLLGAARPSSGGEECQISSGTPVVALLEAWVRCSAYMRTCQLTCGSIRNMVAAEIRRQGDATVPELVALFRARPELRSAAVDALRELAQWPAPRGQAGLDGLRQLGSEGIHAMPEVIGRTAHDWAPILRGLGSQARDALMRMLHDLNPEDRRFAAACLSLLGEVLGPDEVDALLEVMEASPDPEVRYVCAGTAARLVGSKALPGLMRILQRQGLDSRERSRIAALLVAIDDPAAVQALVGVLKDPSVDRGARWGLAQDMKRSGHPSAVAAAKQYGPTGSRGQGNPESPLGSILTALFLGGAALTMALWKGPLTVKERTRLIIGGTVGVYLAAAVAIPATAVLVLGMDAAPLWLLASYWVFLLAGTSACVAVTKGPQLRAAYVPAVGIGAALGFVGGVALDRTVNWYLERSTSQLLGFYQSPLVLAVTLAGALLGSHVLRRRPE